MQNKKNVLLKGWFLMLEDLISCEKGPIIIKKSWFLMLEELLSYKKPDHRGSDHNHGMITVNMGVVFSENVPDTNILGKKINKVK